MVSPAPRGIPVPEQCCNPSASHPCDSDRNSQQRKRRRGEEPPWSPLPTPAKVHLQQEPGPEQGREGLKVAHLQRCWWLCAAWEAWTGLLEFLQPPPANAGCPKEHQRRGIGTPRRVECSGESLRVSNLSENNPGTFPAITRTTQKRLIPGDCKWSDPNSTQVHSKAHCLHLASALALCSRELREELPLQGAPAPSTGEAALPSRSWGTPQTLPHPTRAHRHRPSRSGWAQ